MSATSSGTRNAASAGSGSRDVFNAYGMVPICAILLALRKPWALHTPQLWAEDGSIFLTQDEQMGAAALLEPYNGYLHMLPRLIAWIASHTADVAWWPAIYNGFAFAIAIAVFARLASQRVELPSKPWLMLALVLVANNGEILLNVTNVQWTAAFFLIIHLFTRPARSVAERVADVTLLIVIGLNGPFAIVLLPLFAWRAWRERRLDPALAFGAIAFCSVVQAVFLARTNLNLVEPGMPFQPLRAFAIAGSRLVSWTLFGPGSVQTWPLWVHGALGVVMLLPLLAWALRRNALRSVRGPLVALFCLITVASLYRARADTWAVTDLTSGDRYNFIPRVLLAWLLILEFHTRERPVAWAARALCIVGAIAQAPHFRLPEPPDYRWAEHCDPIRRGVPANIYTLPEGWWIEYPGRPKR